MNDKVNQFRFTSNEREKEEEKKVNVSQINRAFLVCVCACWQFVQETLTVGAPTVLITSYCAIAQTVGQWLRQKWGKAVPDLHNYRTHAPDSLEGSSRNDYCTLFSSGHSSALDIAPTADALTKIGKFFSMYSVHWEGSHWLVSCCSFLVKSWKANSQQPFSCLSLI